ncbi:MAG: molybdopterin cofactor-binding domain-containing protein [Burkholderiaceae bacterium]
MSAPTSRGRRRWLIGATAIAGGVAFGTYWVRGEPHNPLRDDLAEGVAVFNPWVKITAHQVILIVPHTDLGQGVASMQAALIAEELDIGLDQVETEFGLPSAAYYNTAIGADLVPFASTDDSMLAGAVRGAMGIFIKLNGLQSTGGSSSVPDSFVKLRMAGAVARETLKQAAAVRTGLAPDQLRTEDGAVVLPDGSRLAYTALAADAAALEPVTDVRLRDPSQWRLIGKPMQRRDILAKSMGAATYTIDLRMPGMLHASLRCSPRRGALIRYDAGKAQTMRGVIKVVPVENGVAVIADNTWRAMRALDAIEFEWAPAPFPPDSRAHWEAVAASFVDDRLDRRWRDDGNVDTVLGTGRFASAEFRAPYLAHQPMEPLSAVVRVGDGAVDIWAAHQVPRTAADKVAAITGHDVDRVRLHNQFAGGSFGHRLEFDFVTRAAEVANQYRGAPIKLTYSREEDFRQEFPRPLGMARGSGAVADGRVQAFDLAIAVPSVMRSQLGRLGQPALGPDVQSAAGAWNLPYAIPNFRVSAYNVNGLMPVSSWRSVGASLAGFFADAWLDELIQLAGADPLQERLRLCNDPVARKVLEAVAEMSGWGEPIEQGRGRGVAFVNSFGVPTAEVVEVSQTDRGIRIDAVFVAADVGRVVDPVNFDNQVKGAVVWGLGHAMGCELTLADGIIEQRNFDTHAGMRIWQCPKITVRGLENARNIRGVGEPPVPPAAPALANAIFKVTGQRLREMPFGRHVRFA